MTTPLTLDPGPVVRLVPLAGARPLTLIPAPREALDDLPRRVTSPPLVRSWSTPPAPRLSPAMSRAASAIAVAPPAPSFVWPCSDEPERVSRPRSRPLDHALTVLALLGLIMIGLTVTATVTGLRPLVVRSGSMEPVIHTGGMVVVRTIPAAQIRVGEIVAVDRPDGVRVTHRVLSATPVAGGRVQLQLKGDANTDPDPFPVVVAKAGRVVYSAPWLGRVSAELASARGGFALGALMTAVLATTFRGRRRS